MSECVLCVDIGTTSLKAGLITAIGEVVSFCSIQFSKDEKQFAAKNWICSLKNALDSIRKDDVFIKAIAVSGNGPTLVLDNGFTLFWNDFPEEKINTGTLPENLLEFKNSIFLPRLLLLKNKFKNEFENSSKIYSGPEFLIHVLTGNDVTILPEKRFLSAYWSDELLEYSGISCKRVCPYVELGHDCGRLTSDMSSFLGLDSIPVIGVGPDFVAALIGTDTVSNGTCCDRSGSSEGINLCVDKQVYAAGIRTLPSVTPGLWNMSVLIPESSSLQEEERLEKVYDSVKLLQDIAKKNDLIFPSQITVTGGQAKDKEYLKRKEKKLGLKLVVKECEDAELLGDASTAWKTILKKGN